MKGPIIIHWVESLSISGWFTVYLTLFLCNSYRWRIFTLNKGYNK